MIETEAERLTLSEALLRWCDPVPLQAVAQAEAHLPIEWTDRGGRVRIGPLAGPVEYWGDEDRQRTYLHRWAALELDFRRRIERGELHLLGIPSKPDVGAQPMSIPGAWAAELDFDFQLNTASRKGQRYLAIQVSKKPLLQPGPPTDDGRSVRGVGLAEGTIRDLTDKQILLLLDEYARRVVEEEGSSLRLPAKVSFIPILRRKMRRRVELGQNASTLATEAAALEAWIRSKVDGHQTPSTAYIVDQLRAEYRRLQSQDPHAGSKD